MKKTYIKPQTRTVALNNEHFIAATVTAKQISISTGTAVASEYTMEGMETAIKSDIQSVASINFGEGSSSVYAVRKNSLWDDGDGEDW